MTTFNFKVRPLREPSRERFDRSRLPAIDDYCARNGFVRRKGTGRELRFDCPLAEHSHRGNLAVNPAKGLWHCMGGCGGGDVLALHMRLTGQSFVEGARDLGAMVGGDEQVPPLQARVMALPRLVVTAAEVAERERKERRALALWDASEPIVPGTPAHAYLVGRGCVEPPADGDLRWTPHLTEFGFSGPALLGRMTMAQDAARLVGLHLTWIGQDGGRWRRLERRYLGPKGGAVVRLWPDDAVLTGIGIAEGIETALGAAHAFRPTWACMDAGNLERFPVLDGIRSLTVFADNDANGTGQRAAETVARRWTEAGREVRVIVADRVGEDILDEVTE